MTKRFPYVGFSIIFVLGLSGFVIYENVNGKISAVRKTAGLNEKIQTTGVAAVGYDTTFGAAFIEHRLEGQDFPNTLYQGFLAVHFDEIDTVFHSAVGRTNGGKSPGDYNTFRAPDPSHLLEDSNGLKLRYSADTVSNFHITQTVRAVNDSSTMIFLSFVFEFINPPGGTATFSNFKVLFGYDGDIGSTLGGYLDDSTGFYSDDSAAVVYVFDHNLNLYSGVGLVSKNLSAEAGNYRWLHKTINDSAKTGRDLDTLLLGLMNHPNFSSLAQRSDVSVYWSIDLGTIQPADTLRDTIQFLLVNGVTKNNLIQSARGHKVIVKNDSHVSEALPSAIRLYPNYPNPFNPATTIRYDLDREAFVSLRIYNVLGQEIRTLVAARQPAGNYTTVWDGKNNQGLSAAAGIYFYRLQAGRFIHTHKMALIK